MKKTTLLLLSLVMVLSSMTACAENKENTDSTESIQETAAQLDDVTAETAEKEDFSILSDDLPDKDFDGFTYAIYTRNITSHSPFIVEDLTGEVLNDAVFERNSNIADRFNIEFIESLYTDEGMPLTLVQAGDDTYTLMNVRCTAADTMAQKNYCYNISELEYIDLNKGYWDKSLTDDIAVGKNYYSAIGDTNLTTIDFTNVLLFNKNMLADYALEDIYTLVDEGRWTFDKYGEYGSTVLLDLNGDGKMNADDEWGMLGVAKYLHCSLIQAAGVMYISKDEDGYPVYDMATNEKFIEVFEKIFQICNDSGAWYLTNDGDNESTTYHNMFRNNQGLFLTTMFYLIESMRDMESEFGVIPFPKYNEEQENYITRVSFFDTSVIPVTVSDIDRASIILEALTCESHNVVIPAYYDIALKSKYARDEESQRMIDIILGSRVLDFGDTYFQGNLRDGFVAPMFINNNREIVSTASKYQKSFNKSLERMIEAYQVLEELS